MIRIEEEVRSCRRCGLWKNRKRAVPGEGSLDASIVFIGEAPGYWEDVKGRPFVGAAGKLLDEMLSKAGFSRSEVYITNILKCRPPRNRDPLPDEIERCTPYLDRQLQIIKPRLIVTLGRHSAKHILSKLGYKISGITRTRGKIYET
ncbi:MAG: uracil-DNA glycosylase family protein, partial [Candidatus Bathyarchaeia archaeon]